MKVAEWTILNLQSSDGHFFYRDLGWKKIKTPMLHWGQGTTFKALAHLLSKINHQQPLAHFRNDPMSSGQMGTCLTTLHLTV